MRLETVVFGRKLARVVNSESGPIGDDDYTGDTSLGEKNVFRHHVLRRRQQRSRKAKLWVGLNRFPAASLFKKCSFKLVYLFAASAHSDMSDKGTRNYYHLSLAVRLSRLPSHIGSDGGQTSQKKVEVFQK
jgi:hypothetical protein